MGATLYGQVAVYGTEGKMTDETDFGPLSAEDC